MNPPRTSDMDDVASAIRSGGVRPLDTSTLGPIKVDTSARRLRAKVVREALEAVARIVVDRDPQAARMLSGAGLLIDDEAACMLGRLLK